MFWGKVNLVSLCRPQLEPLVYTCRTLGLLPWLGLFQVYWSSVMRLEWVGITFIPSGCKKNIESRVAEKAPRTAWRPACWPQNQQRCVLPPLSQTKGGGGNSLHTHRLNPFWLLFALLCVKFLMIWVVRVGKRVLQLFKAQLNGPEQQIRPNQVFLTFL